jgi:hypothetical protein
MRRIVTWLKVTLPLGVLLTPLLLYWPKPPSYLPEKLWGVWKTDHERYAGRYLDISEAIFTIGQGREHLQVFFVQRVDRVPAATHERYTLYYLTREQAGEPLQTLSVDFFTTDEGDRIRLKNQKDILWYREADRESVPSARAGLPR